MTDASSKETYILIIEDLKIAGKNSPYIADANKLDKRYS